MHRASFQSPACRFIAEEPEARWAGSGERGREEGGRKNGYHRAPSTDEHNGGLESVQGGTSRPTTTRPNRPPGIGRPRAGERQLTTTEQGRRVGMNGYGTVLQGLPGRRPVHPARGARVEVKARLKSRFVRTSNPHSRCGGPLSRHRRLRTGDPSS